MIDTVRQFNFRINNQFGVENQTPSGFHFTMLSQRGYLKFVVSLEVSSEDTMN